MCRNRVVQVRLTERQYERFILRKDNEGYKTISQFVRDLMLKDDMAMLKLVQEIHKRIVVEKNGKN
ncbi:hypothetical protein HYW75_04345 [Candidatus Pacearchaeota archaeon]|jgi:hypothetical protein|nr:hypothetical protein [Candidatus Pacearchaeota archaeon]